VGALGAVNESIGGGMMELERVDVLLCATQLALIPPQMMLAGQVPCKGTVGKAKITWWVVRKIS
jgi:hypothetical protein